MAFIKNIFIPLIPFLLTAHAAPSNLDGSCDTCNPFAVLQPSGSVNVPPTESSAASTRLDRDSTYENGVAHCGNDNKISCCNSNSNNNAGLLGVNLGSILGPCTPLDIPVIGVNALLSDQCKTKVACCPSNGNGRQDNTLVDLKCTQIDLI
ncbi:hypothetical protein GQ53DRAFT_365586 [Thozetella sp. PMI_491]|nr:hypothetical protein GQ53DRAFT_365586 [Thozetella sp. PMI_491]